MLHTAYYYPFMSEKLLAGVGFSAGYARHNVHIDELNFGSQYVNDGFDATRESGEQWQENAFGYFDCAVGTNLILRLNENWSAGGQISVMWLPQWTGDKSKDGSYTALAVMAGARYHF